MSPLLRCLLLATTLSYALAYVPGGFEEGGNTLVSAMMVSQGVIGKEHVFTLSSRCSSVARTACTSWTRQKGTLHRSMGTLRGGHCGTLPSLYSPRRATTTAMPFKMALIAPLLLHTSSPEGPM